MSDAKKLPRPPQVSLAGWVTIVGSLFVVLGAFEVIGNNRSIETRERLTEALSQEPFAGAGISLQQALDFMHGAALVGGASAAAAAILGWFVMQRQKSARLALSVVAVPLFLSGLVMGGFVSSVVAVCAVMLWGKPARDWFNGIAPAQAAERTTPPPPPAHRSVEAPRGEPSDEPRPYSGFGTPAGQPQAQGQVHDAPAAWTGAATDGVRRPPDVLRACLATWILCGIVALGAVLALVGFAFYPDQVQEMYAAEARLADSGLTLAEVRTASMVMAVIFMAWALLAAAIAIAVHRGHDWARIVLVCSSACAGLLALLMALASPPLLLVAAACGYSIFALLRRPSNEWFRAQRR